MDWIVSSFVGLLWIAVVYFVKKGLYRYIILALLLVAVFLWKLLTLDGLACC